MVEGKEEGAGEGTRCDEDVVDHLFFRTFEQQPHPSTVVFLFLTHCEGVPRSRGVAPGDEDLYGEAITGCVPGGATLGEMRGCDIGWERVGEGTPKEGVRG